MPHSKFLAWLSSATLKCFIPGVSSQILMPEKANLVYSSSRLRWQPQNEDDLKNEGDHKNEDGIKNEDDLKNENDLKNKENLQKIICPTPHLKEIKQI